MKNPATNSRPTIPEKQWRRALGLVATALLIAAFVTVALLSRPNSSSSTTSFLFRTPLLSSSYLTSDWISNATLAAEQLDTIVHYATSKITPQQSREEIDVSFAVLKAKAPCNFLVFGLGYDSRMWAALNPGGTTLFLEEDPTWVKSVLKDAPFLKAKAVEYRTRLDEADHLLQEYRKVDECRPTTAFLKGNTRCRLALENLPDEVYEKEWDLIMIDAPRGYFAAAPGRMAAIFSAAVMARHRKGDGPTHVFVHDMNRKVEKVYADEFLCQKNLAGSVGRLCHFAIPPAGNNTSAAAAAADKFC